MRFFRNTRFNAAHVAIVLALLVLCGCTSATRQPEVAKPLLFGVLTDVHVSGHKDYRGALGKLEKCVADLNQRDLAFVIQLGDIINGRGAESVTDLDQALSAYGKLTAPAYHVVGNHCLSAGGQTLMTKLGLQSFWYDFTVPSAKGWRFVVLGDVGTGIGGEQLKWFRSTLAKASKAGERVIVFCHYPMRQGAVQQAIDESGCVVAWINGHWHPGRYEVKNGVHYVNLRAMVTAPHSAYAVMELSPNEITETGFGDEPSRRLMLPRQPKATQLRKAED